MASDHDSTIRVLVVDDHAVVRRGLRSFLDGEPDLEVVGDVSGGAEALELLEELDAKEQRPHVIVMDLKMEPVDGIEATRRIRELYEDVEVVVLTSFGDDEHVRAALDAGASGYLLKDADADEVALAIRAARRGGFLLDPALARRLTGPMLGEHTDAAAEGLTEREVEVLRLVGAGQTNRSIATSLSISERTARTHVSHILGKLKLKSRTQAALWATREGLAGPAAPADSPPSAESPR